LALLDGDGDFSRSICTANNCGKDTDCTAATVGALLGILNPDGIEERWLKPIGRDLILSKPIVGLTPPDSLDAFTDLVLDLKERVNGAFPPGQPDIQLPDGAGVPVRVGFREVPWFGQGWPLSFPMELELPEMKPVVLEGTYARMNASAFEAGMMFLEYTFELNKETNARVFFNTGGNCRVFLNGEFVFGRECGRMAPSSHRLPISQSVDRTLPGGRHVVTAVIAKPVAEPTVEWVAGVADRDDFNQWVPHAFVVGGQEG
jgi:hypothetical protein